MTTTAYEHDANSQPLPIFSPGALAAAAQNVSTAGVTTFTVSPGTLLLTKPPAGQDMYLMSLPASAAAPNSATMQATGPVLRGAAIPILSAGKVYVLGTNATPESWAPQLLTGRESY